MATQTEIDTAEVSAYTNKNDARRIVQYRLITELRAACGKSSPDGHGGGVMPINMVALAALINDAKRHNASDELIAEATARLLGNS